MRTNRSLDLLGVPDLPVRAFIKEGGQIKPQGGGSGGGAPTSQTVTQTNIPEYARPYAEEMLGQAQILTDTTANPYQPFTGQRFAGFSPMQAQAFQNVAGQQVAPQITDASNLAYTSAMQGLGVQPTAQALQQTALGYGQAGAGYGGAASTLGIAGAQQAAMDAQRAQRAAQLYGGMGAQAGQAGMGYGALGAQFGQQAAGFGAQGAQQAGMVSDIARQQAMGYGQAGAQFGTQGLTAAQQAQRQAEIQADLYGQMGAGFGAAGAGMAPQAQAYGQTAANIGTAGMGYGVQGVGIGGRGVTAAEQGFGAGAQYAQQATSPESMQAYMSPYMQNVVQQQQREAVRASNIARQAEQARAVGQGAFGGSRSAIVEAEMQRNLGTQLSDIQAQGLQRAYEQAQQAQQFGAGLGIQGLQAGYQGLQTGLAGTAQGMEGARTGIAGQQAGLAGLQQAGQLYGLGMQGAGLGLQGTGQRLAAGQLGLQGTAQAMQGAGMGLQGVGQQLAAGQLGLQGTAQGIQGAQAGMQGAQTGISGAQAGISGAQAGLQGVGQQIAGGQLGLQGTQAGISGQQAGIQGAQAGMQGVGQAVGAGQYGLAGSELALRGAGTLGNLGGQQFEQEMAVTDALQKYGALQQQQQQQGLDFAYQQFLARQQYPYQQLSFMSDLLRGVPSTQSAVYQYQQQPAVAPQLLGAGLAAYGAFGRKEGGQIKKYQAGGQVSPDAMSTMAVQELPSKLRRLSDSQLAAYARTVKDAITLSAIQGELNRRQRARMPGGEMPQDTTAEQIAQRAEAAGIGRARVGMAGGGIVALQAGGMPAFSGGEEFGVDPETLESSRSVFERMTTIPQGPYSGTPTTGTGASYVPRLPEVKALPPADTDAEGQMIDPALAQARLEEDLIRRIQQEQQQQQRQQGPGIVGAAAARGMRPGSFEEFRAMIPRGQMDPAQQAILNDMQSRITKQAERADSQRDLAKYDAALAAGLAMMGGTSLADGIARAAQQGGASYFASRKDAEKAIDNAEKAELAFRQYELEVMKGNEDAARKEFATFLDYTAAMANVDAKYAAAAAKGTGGLDAKDVSLLRGRINDELKAEFGDVLPTTDVERAQLAADIATRRRQLEAYYGVPPVAQTQTSSAGGADRPSLSSFVK